MNSKRQKVHLLCIDPQNDFMDLKGSALPVSGANADMVRLAEFIRKHGQRLEDIHITMDSHQVVDIAHPSWWVNKKRENANPFTLITADDIKAGIWSTRNPSVAARSLAYVETLERTGKYNLFIWPEHCLIGTWGHGVQEDLMKSLLEWQKKEYASIDFVTKGSNPYTEHYGALMAEVPDPKDPTTQLNTDLIKTLQEADVILVAGEASSHCVKETLNQVLDNIGDEHIRKIKILTDCTSPVAAVPGGPDFPQIAREWIKEIQTKGVELVKSTEFFS